MAQRKLGKKMKIEKYLSASVSSIQIDFQNGKQCWLFVLAKLLELEAHNPDSEGKNTVID